MIAISVKKDRVNFLSAFRSGREIEVNDFGVIQLKSNTFNSQVISQILNRRKIRKSPVISKKCMIFIDSSEVILNQIRTGEKVDSDTLVQWNNDLMFNDTCLDRYNDLHYQTCKDANILSVYIEKSKQSHYYSSCKKIDLNLSCLSINIFSAEYLAREIFDAKSDGNYAIWGIGAQKDNLMIVHDNQFVGLITFKRSKKDMEIVDFIGPEKYLLDCIDKINTNNFSELKSANLINKVYAYQKSLKTDIKKIIKKNKDSIEILNPLLKIPSFKKRRNEDIKSSFLAEMGYIFKMVESSGVEENA